MRRMQAILGMLALWALQAVAAPDPKLLAYVSPEMKLLGGIEVKKGLATPFGQFLLSQVPPNAAFEQFAAASGFDYKKDLLEVLVAAPGPTPGKVPTDRNLVVASGNFDLSKLVNLANLTGGSAEFKDGIQWIKPAQGPPGQMLAFVDDSIALAGAPDLIDAALAFNTAAKPNDAALIEKAKIAGADNELWFVSTTPITEMLAQMPTPLPLQIFDPIMGYSAGLHFEESGGTISAEVLTRTEKDAQTLAKVLKLAAGMAKAPALPLNQMQVDTSGSTIRMKLSLTETQMEQLVKPPARTERVAR